MSADKKPSPSFLAPKPAVKKANKKVLTAIIVVVSTLTIILFLTMTSNKNVVEDSGLKVTTIDSDNKPLSAAVDGFGLAVPEIPKIKERKEGINEPQIKVVGPPKANPEEEARRREADEIRRRKFERNQQAFGSNILVKRENSTAAGGVGAGSVDKDGDGYIDEPTAYNPNYDPAADVDKEAFFKRSAKSDWVSPYSREAGFKYEVKTGTVIPGVMISGINSDLPGALIAQISQNVFDTATGKHLLFPQGSKLYGTYDSRVVYGQRRVLIAWNRVIYPDGTSVTLGAMPGADISGYAGFEDKVNNHYLRIFGSAVLMSAIAGGSSYAIDKLDNNDDESSTTMQGAMGSALAAQIGQTAMKLLEQNLNIKPTLEIRPGYEFNIVVTKDVVFKGAYARK